MKRIAPTIAFCSSRSLFLKIAAALTVQPFRLKTQELLPQRSCLAVVVSIIMLIIFAPQSTLFGQQVLGSFPTMDGGFESQSGTLATLATPIVAAQTAYTRNNNNVAGTINTTGGRSAPKYMSLTTSNTGEGFYTPTAPIAQNTQYVVQYYFRYNGGSNRCFTFSGTSNGGTNWGSGVSGSNVNGIVPWTKRIEVLTSNNNAPTGFGVIRSGSKGGGISTAFDIDDYVVYAGNAADVAAPNDVTAPLATYFSSTQLNISWTAPAGGVDGGGYVVLRYLTDPSAEPAPNANGIYTTASSIGNGAVAYIGTGTSFPDVGLTANTLYYYRVYAVDKAFNYSAAPAVFVGITAAVAPPVVSLTMPGVVAASIERSSLSDIIYSFSLTATTYYTALTQLTFQNTSGTYNSTDFANFKLYASSINSFPGGTPLATIVAPSNISPQTFTGFSKIIPPSPAAIYFWITTDVKALATIGNSITVTPDLASGNLSFSGAPPTVGIASVTASGAQTIVAPAQYTWNGGSAGSWIVATNWAPNRTTPKASDDIIFNTAGTITVTNTPVAETISSLLITNNSNVILSSGATSIITILNISGLGFPDLTVNSGSALTLGSLANITLGTGTTADISGVLNISSGSNYNTNAANATTTVTNATYPLAVDGIINNNSGTLTSTIASKLVVKNGAVYNHNVDGGTIPTATWNANSTCLISGINSQQSMSGHGQTFSKLVWDCPAQSQTHFILGQNVSNASPCVIADSFIVKRTNGKILQLTFTSGQKDFTCGNFFQYGGIVAITYNTNASGQLRTLAVSNTFYVTDSIETPSRFQIINNPGSTNNIIGRLYVKGNIEMHKNTGSGLSLLELKKDNLSNPSTAELWFTGSGAPQQVVFSTISDSVDFVMNHTSSGVNLASNANSAKFKLMQGTFYIGSNTLTIMDSVAYPAPGNGLLGGSAASNLILGGRHAGTALNFASGYRILKDFTQLANSNASLGTDLSITAGTVPGRDSIGASATLTTNDNLILKSDINGTARMAQLPATATIVGKVTVERYLPMNLNYDSRRWRLLTAPFKTTNAPTINAAWQEGVSNSDRALPIDPRPGYGTQITKSTTYNSDGYDQGSTNNPSIYYYSGGNWTAPANTNNVKITDNSGCYMLFARGDRSILISDRFVAATPTTLEPKGELNVGDVTVFLTSSGYQTVGNPYASEIKLDNITFNDTAGNKKTIYLWDPKTLGSFNVGKFITCSGDGGSPATYTYAGNTSAYNSKPGVIESSAAFMVQGNGGNIVFHESDKTMESSTIGIASRPSSPANSFGKIRKLYTDLFVIRSTAPVLADGVANTYNKNYKNSVDYFDAPKLTSFTSKEELSIKRDNQLFAIERRKSVKKTDTIFLNISKLNQTAYQFGFRPVEFDNTYSACIADKFLRTVTPFSLSQPSTFSFGITADPASAATDRFYIIFKKIALPKNIRLKAVLNNDDIELDWEGSDLEDAESQCVERSTDGIHFTVVATLGSASNSAREIPGEWLDKGPLPGSYYYRIRSNAAEGETIYSNIVKVTRSVIASAPAIFPNPVLNGKINLNMGLLPGGTYTIKIINSIGQVVYSGNIIHQNRYAAEKIDLENKNTKGIYRLEIISANKTIAALNMLMQ